MTAPNSVCFAVALFIDPVVTLSVPLVTRVLVKRHWPGWKAWALVAGAYGFYSILVIHTVGYALSAYILGIPCAFLNGPWNRVVENCGSPFYELYAAVFYWILPTIALWLMSRRRARKRAASLA